MSVHFRSRCLAVAALGAILAAGCASSDDSDRGGESVVEAPGTPLEFPECADRMADSCPAAAPLCVSVDGPGGGDSSGSFFSTWWTFCTRECETDDDCASGLEGGTAVPRCERWNGDQKVCVLDCSFGRTCPDGLGGCQNTGVCGNQECDCGGDGCADPLCEFIP